MGFLNNAGNVGFIVNFPMWILILPSALSRARQRRSVHKTRDPRVHLSVIPAECKAPHPLLGRNIVREELGEAEISALPSAPCAGRM